MWVASLRIYSLSQRGSLFALLFEEGGFVVDEDGRSSWGHSVLCPKTNLNKNVILNAVKNL